MDDKFCRQTWNERYIILEFYRNCNNEHNTWLDAKNGSRSRRDYRKLHIVTAENGIIISYDITHARCHDAPIFEQIWRHLPHGSGHVMLDAAYLSRNICTLIEKTGRIPVIMPRKGVRVRGFDAMGRCFDGIVIILMNFYQYATNAAT